MEASENNVQPEGQGEGSDIGSFFDLSDVPEDYLPHLEPVLKNVQKNVDGKFREHADYRKQWEPYESLSLNDYEPEAIEQLLDFANMINNDQEGFKEWWTKVGEELGFADELPNAANEDDDDDDDFDDIDFDDDDDDDIESKIEAKVQERLNEALTPLLEKAQQDEQAEAMNQANSLIDQQIDALKEEHGEFDEQAVYRFALAHDDNDAIQKGFQDYQRFVGGLKEETINGRVNGPTPPEGEGKANTGNKPVTDYKEAGQIAKERLSQMNSG